MLCVGDTNIPSLYWRHVHGVPREVSIFEFLHFFLYFFFFYKKERIQKFTWTFFFFFWLWLCTVWCLGHIYVFTNAKKKTAMSEKKDFFLNHSILKKGRFVLPNSTHCTRVMPVYSFYFLPGLSIVHTHSSRLALWKIFSKTVVWSSLWRFNFKFCLVLTFWQEDLLPTARLRPG